MPDSIFLAAAAYPVRSLADPSGSNAIVSAVQWLEGTVLGTVATVIAVLAVAWLGMMMLTGRTPVRRGLTVVAGCFILFGASTIAAGLRSVVDGGDGAAVAREAAPPPPPPESTPPEYPPANNDPYAGAAVPRP